MIYIGFSRPTTFFPIFSWLIRLIEWTRFSHVYIRYFDTYTKEWIIFEASHGEVHLIQWNNWREKAITVYEQAFEIEEERKRRLVKFMVKNLQKPYSIKNILGIAIKILTGLRLFKDSNKAFICSELVATALGDRLKFEKELDFVTPKDIYKAIL